MGSVSDRRVRVRIIAATNKDLERAVREGAFRADLYYRLHVITLSVPPLRERREEIPELAETMMTLLRSRFKRPHLRISHAARRRLQEHNWPGNVRELRNCLERACVFSASDEISEEDLSIAAVGLHLVSDSAAVHQEGARVAFMSKAVETVTLADLERSHIEGTLLRVKGNRERAAALLGISSRTLYRKLKEYGWDGGVSQVA